MTTAKKKETPVSGAVETAVTSFETTADMIKGGVDAALDASAEQARASSAFEGVEFAGRDNVDAALKCSQAYFSGLKELSGLVFKTAKDTARLNADAMKDLSGCTSPEDLSQAQMKIVSASFEAMMGMAKEFGQTATKVAGEVTEPLNAQFSSQQSYTKFWPKAGV